MGRHIQNQSQMFFTSAQGCLLYYLLELGTGFDRVLNTLSRHRVVQLNSPNKCLAFFTLNLLLLHSRLLSHLRWSKSVSLSKTMVEPVEVSCRIVASSLLLPANCQVKTSFQLFGPQIFQESNCPALSHAAVSISCMAGAAGE